MATKKTGWKRGTLRTDGACCRCKKHLPAGSRVGFKRVGRAALASGWASLVTSDLLVRCAGGGCQ